MAITPDPTAQDGACLCCPAISGHTEQGETTDTASRYPDGDAGLVPFGQKRAVQAFPGGLKRSV